MLRKPIVDGLLAAFRGHLIIAILLLVPAGLVPGGTWLWPKGLAFVGVSGAIAAAGNVLLASLRPAHFAVRQQSVVASKDRKQPLLDAAGSVGLLMFGAAWLVFLPLDVFYLRLLPDPGALVSIAGGLCVIVGAALYPLAAWENRFATPNVQEQADLGQRVIDTGIYGVIRHPIYAANFLVAGGAALWLGSYAAAAIGLGVLAVMTVGRIIIEEAHLRANLPGYADYARRVRGRLIPFLL